MKLRFQQKLFFAFVVVIFITAVPLLVFLSVNLKNWIWARTETSLGKELVLLQALAESKIAYPYDPPAIDRFVDDLAESLDIRISFIDAGGRVLGDSAFSGPALSDLENHATRPEVQMAHISGKGKSVRRSASAHGDFLYMARPVTVGEGVTAAVRASVPLAEITRLVSQGQKTLVWGTALSGLLALILSFVIARRLSYPVRVMTRIAGKMARLDFEEKIRIGTRDEHGELADSLNKLSTALKGHIDVLSQTNAELEATLKGMQEGLLVTNERGEILHFNPAGKAMFGVTEIAERPTILTVLRHVRLNDTIKAVLATGRPSTVEVRPDHAPSSFYLARVAPVYQSNGTWGTVSVFHDVTDIRRTEQMRRDFVANVSHELKTPLTSIRGFAETLLDAPDGQKALIRKNIETIHRQAGALGTLISDLLDLAAIESGEIKMKKRALNVATLLENMASECAALAQNKEVSVSVALSPDLPSVEADPRWIHQALTNLVTNAIYYNRPGGSVTLEAEAHGTSELMIRIRDTGIGIAAQDIPRIFERFYRVDRARSRASGGTGLGLSIVKHIVEAHAGRMVVSSTPGTGTAISFFLPL